MGGLTQRERFWQWANYEDKKDIPAWGDWVGPYEFWLDQGMPPMPAEYKDHGGAAQYMMDLWNFEGIYSAFWGSSRVPVNIGLCPGYTPEILEETDTHVIKRMGDGTVCKEMRDPNSTLIAQEYLSYPLRGPENWEEFRDTQLDPSHPGRYPDEETWKELKAAWKDRDYILTIDGGSFYGNVRNWMGVENISYAFYDEPEWMHEVMDYLADLYIQVLGRALKEVDVDIALFWEDMCYKNGPLISPEMFREFLLKPYQKVTRFLEENGVKLSFVDCDGNIDALVPLWLEGGVRGFYPLERASGMDPLPLLEKYEKDKILLWGNVDKRELKKSKEAIDRELERLKPAVEKGGFIPLVDHGVPEDIPYENFCYYTQKRKELFSIREIPRKNRKDLSLLGGKKVTGKKSKEEKPSES